MIERNFEMNLIVEYKVYSDLEPKIKFISDFNNQITIKIDENSIIKFLCYQKIIYKENGEYKKIATDGENPEKIRESQIEQGFESFKNEFLLGEKYNKGTYYNEEGEILINAKNLFKNKIEENKICPVVSQDTGLVQYIKMNENLNGKLPCEFFFENNLKEKQKEENKKNNCCDEKTTVANSLAKVNSNKENNNNCSITNNNNDNTILLENTAKKKDLIDENYIEILDDNINESFHSSNKKRVKENKKKNNNNKNDNNINNNNNDNNNNKNTNNDNNNIYYQTTREKNAKSFSNNSRIDNKKIYYTNYSKSYRPNYDYSHLIYKSPNHNIPISFNNSHLIQTSNDIAKYIKNSNKNYDSYNLNFNSQSNFSLSSTNNSIENHHKNINRFNTSAKLNNLTSNTKITDSYKSKLSHSNNYAYLSSVNSPRNSSSNKHYSTTIDKYLNLNSNNLNIKNVEGTKITNYDYINNKNITKGINTNTNYNYRNNYIKSSPIYLSTDYNYNKNLYNYDLLNKNKDNLSTSLNYLENNRHSDPNTYIRGKINYQKY